MFFLKLVAILLIIAISIGSVILLSHILRLEKEIEEEIDSSRK